MAANSLSNAQQQQARVEGRFGEGRLLWGTTFARIAPPYGVYSIAQQPPYPAIAHEVDPGGLNYSEAGAPNRFSTYANTFRSFHLAWGRQTYLRSWSAGGVDRFSGVTRVANVARYDPSSPQSRTPVVPVWKRWLGDVPLFFQPVAQRTPPWQRTPFNQT